MNEFPNPHDESAPSIIDRIESLEPYVAIRFLILQIAVAVAVGLTASRNIESLTTAIEGLPDPGTLFDLNQLAKYGYPIRELIWAGDWWRIPAGVFLPPQWMLWGIACVAMLPFSKYLEARIGRLRSLGIYLLGAVTPVLVDLLSYGGVTSGALGMVMATGGAAWVLLRLDGFRIMTSTLEIPGVAWFLLFLLAPIAWIHSSLHFDLDPVTASVTPLVPSWIALLIAAITGMTAVLPYGVRKMREASQRDGTEGLGLWNPRLARTVAVLWGVTVAVYGLLSWIADYRLDHRLWTLEPGVQAGDTESLKELEELASSNPNEPFLTKRLAIHHLREGEWDQGRLLLESLLESATDTENLLLDLKRRGRLAHLNLRGPGEWLSWRYSGISSNYATDRSRILLDLAQTAHMSGDAERLEKFRDRVLAANDDLMEARVEGISRTVEENEDLRDKEPTAEETYRKNRLRAQKLNGEAYMLAELGGDLEAARSKAEEAVSLLNDPMLQDTLGWIKILSGDLEEGKRLIEDALFAPGSPASGTIHYHLAVALEKLGKLDRAREVYRKALSLDLEWWEERDIRQRCSSCIEPPASPRNS
ncbi:MAG: tetratricopeptide repeat protein [Candidatus Omnitrophica bacterium]|nr:tetratricopeptide repeat protein [Candidatus Omnitrophota bacterium]